MRIKRSVALLSSAAALGAGGGVYGMLEQQQDTESAQLRAAAFCEERYQDIGHLASERTLACLLDGWAPNHQSVPIAKMSPGVRLQALSRDVSSDVAVTPTALVVSVPLALAGIVEAIGLMTYDLLTDVASPSGTASFMGQLERSVLIQYPRRTLS